MKIVVVTRLTSGMTVFKANLVHKTALSFYACEASLNGCWFYINGAEHLEFLTIQGNYCCTELFDKGWERYRGNVHGTDDVKVLFDTPWYTSKGFEKKSRY